MVQDEDKELYFQCKKNIEKITKKKQKIIKPKRGYYDYLVQCRIEYHEALVKHGKKYPLNSISSNICAQYDIEDVQFIKEVQYYLNIAWAKCCCERPTQDIQPITFTTQIDRFFDRLYKFNKPRIFEKVGTFNGVNKIIIRGAPCSKHNYTIDSANGELIYKTIPGKWKIYKGKHCAYWDVNGNDWNSTVLAINNKLKAKLSTLTWTLSAAYAQHTIDIISADDFCNIKGKKKYGVTWRDYESLAEDNNGYIFLDDGVSLSAPERRQRYFMYGKDKDNNILAIFIPTLG